MQDYQPHSAVRSSKRGAWRRPFAPALICLLAAWLAPPAGALSLHDAAAAGDLAAARALLDKGANVNELVEHETPLHVAAWAGQTEMAKLLLERGAKVATGDRQGRTALHRAVWAAHADTARLLLERGADVNARDDSGETPVFCARLQGRRSVLGVLLERGADVNAKDKQGGTPLCHVGSDVVGLLLDRGADVKVSKYSPLVTKFFYHDWQAMEVLLGKGADPNVLTGDNMTILAAAKGDGFHAISRLVLDHGATMPALQMAAYHGETNALAAEAAKGVPLDKADQMTVGYSALEAAALGGQAAAYQFLLSKGAKEKYADVLLPIAAAGGSVELVERLYPMTQRPFKAEAAMSQAISAGQLPVIRLLLGKGVHDKYDLAQAVASGRTEVIEALLHDGPNREVLNLGLFAAIRCHRVHLVEQLLALGASASAPDTSPDSGGPTPLQNCLGLGDDALPVAKLLLAHGAKAGDNSGDGKTTLELARMAGTGPELVALLRANGAH